MIKTHDQTAQCGTTTSNQTGLSTDLNYGHFLSIKNRKKYLYRFHIT